MAEKKYILFIEKLIEMTKANSLIWEYLDENEKLFQHMGWTNIIGEASFDDAKSFYTSFDYEPEYFIVLLTKRDAPTNLYVIPKTYKNVLILNASEYGEHITRLFNLIRAEFPDPDSFIDRILEI